MKKVFLAFLLLASSNLYAADFSDADIGVFRTKIDNGCHVTAKQLGQVFPLQDMNVAAVCACSQDQFSEKLKAADFDFSYGLTHDLFKQVDSLAVDAMLACFKAPLAKVYEQKMRERCMGEHTKESSSAILAERQASQCACTGANYAKVADLSVLKPLQTAAERDRQVQRWYEDSYNACLKQ